MCQPLGRHLAVVAQAAGQNAHLGVVEELRGLLQDGREELRAQVLHQGLGCKAHVLQTRAPACAVCARIASNLALLGCQIVSLEAQASRPGNGLAISALC